MKHKKDFKLSPNNIGLSAFLVWLASLGFTGLTIYYKQMSIKGYMILITGWLSPLAGNFAWFANIFFIYAFVRLNSGKSILLPAIITSIISLDTFRFDRYLLNEGGSTSPVFGYGWGAVLWFIAITLLLAAAIVRETEIKDPVYRKIDNNRLRIIGYSIPVIVICIVSVVSIYDHKMANSSEKERLAGIAFKRGEICKLPLPTVKRPISDFKGVLQVVAETKLSDSNYPFNQNKYLLQWGIPVLRKGDYDYYLENGQIVSVPATGNASATLYVSEESNNKAKGNNIIVRLVDEISKREVFNQTWVRQNYRRNTDIYCPDFHNFPVIDKQPRKVVMESLGLKDNKVIMESSYQGSDIKRVIATISHTEEGGETSRMERARIEKEASEDNETTKWHMLMNTNCPPDIGVTRTTGEQSLNLGHPFVIGNKKYYPKRRTYYRVFCSGNYAYLYSGAASHGKYYLNITKRDQNDFKQYWKYIIVFPEHLSIKRDRSLKITNLSESSEGLRLKLTNLITGLIIQADAKFHDK